ncbi:hypothetical protein C8F01DRAFT_1375706 [Mycena amicta]|nr:hypothetical protein C8F01DRAFT_1375706 [Mycena amicta]
MPTRTHPTFPLPTTHTHTHAHDRLPERERQRLVRSVRKIRAVLGEEPTVELESDSDTPDFLFPPSSKSGLGFLYSQTSASASSLSLSSTGHKVKPALTSANEERNGPGEPLKDRERERERERPALVLRLPTRGFEPLDLSISLPPTSPTLLSPTATPTQDMYSQRRLRLAKVSRTLGESVPPSLIVTVPGERNSNEREKRNGKGKSKGKRRRRRASMSLVTPESALRQLTFDLGEGRPSTTRSTGGRGRRERRTSVVSFIDMNDPEQETEPAHTIPHDDDAYAYVSPAAPDSPLDSEDPSTLSFAAGPSLYTPSRILNRSWSDDSQPGPPRRAPSPLLALPERSRTFPSATSRAPSPSPSLLPYYPPGISRSVSPAPLHRGSAAFARYYDDDFEPDDIPYTFARSATPGGTQRREEDWTGEWVGVGAHDQDLGMDDVVKRLRGLKFK